MHFIVVLIFLLFTLTFYQRKVLFSKFVYIIAIIYPILPYTYFSGKVIGSLELIGIIIILYLLTKYVLFPNGLHMRKFTFLLITFSLCGIISIHIDFDVFKWSLRILIFTGTLILLARVFSNDYSKVNSLIKYSVIFSTIIAAEFLWERFYFIIDWVAYWNYKSFLALIGLFPMKVLQANVSGWAGLYPVVRTGGLLGFDGAGVGLYFGVIFFMIRVLKKTKMLKIYQLILVFCIIGTLSRIAIFSFVITYIFMSIWQKNYLKTLIICLSLFSGSKYIKSNFDQSAVPLTYIIKRAIGQTKDSYGFESKGIRAINVFGMYPNNRILSALLFGDARLVSKAHGGDNPHNGYIEILFSSGLIGLILFLVLLYKPTKYFLLENSSFSASFGSILILFIIQNGGASYFFQLKEMFVILPPLAAYLARPNFRLEKNNSL